MKKFIPLICSLFLLAVLPAKGQTYELWGMTYWGGLNDAGTIMNLNENTDTLTLAYSFGTPTGEYPMGNLLFGKDSIFYGMTEYDGADSEGVLFSYNPLTGIYTDLVDFDSSNGSFPNGSLIQDTATEKLYGMTSLGGAHNFGRIFSYNPDSNTYTFLHDFDSINGEAPLGNLTWGKNDTVYGMTSLGGKYNDGTIFYFPPGHQLKKLYDFNDTLGMLPSGSLLLDSNILYGMTPYGGANDDGVLFSFNLSDSTYTDLLDFNYANGSNPYGSLLKASNGDLYGMTENGVDSVSDGVIFKYNPDSNSYSVLYVFYNDSVGANPSGSFIQAHDGKLYATTTWGGTHYNGVIFSFDPDSLIYTDIYNLNRTLAGTPYGDLTETPYTANVTGISSVTKNQFSIFPNPSSGLITVISPTIINAVRITDLLGRVVYTSTPKQNNLTLNINETGMFFITLTSDIQTTTSKIIISK
jgi:uncharacterized repeat protein (TIGR03803 family)